MKIAAIKNKFYTFLNRPEGLVQYAFRRPVFLLIITLLVVHVQSSEAVQLIDPVYDGIRGAIEKVTGRLQDAAYHLFFVLATLQFIITMYGELTKGGGEIEAVITKLVKSLVWISFCYWLMSDNNASNFIRDTAQYFLDNAIGFATGTDTKMNVVGVIGAGIDGIKEVVVFMLAISKQSASIFTWTAGINADAIIELTYTLLYFIIIVIIILAVTAYMAVKVLMLKIEVLLITMLLPLNLALLGLNAMRDQGFAPFKHMIALVFRTLILGVVIGGMSSIAQNMGGYLSNNPVDNTNVLQFLTLLVGMVLGYVMLGYLAYKSDAIASSLASGSSSLGSQSDSAMGAALGAMVGAMAGAAAIAGGSQAKAGASSVADIMKSSSISNASESGVGKTPAPPPASPASASSNSSVGGPSKGMPPPPPAETGSSSESSGSQASGGSAAASSSNKEGVSNSSSSATSGDAATGGSIAPTDSGGGATSSSSGSEGSGVDAGIGSPVTNGGGGDRNIKEPNAPPKEKDDEKKKSFMDHVKDHAGKTNQNIAQQDAHTSISMNVHHDD